MRKQIYIVLRSWKSVTVLHRLIYNDLLVLKWFLTLILVIRTMVTDRVVAAESLDSVSELPSSCGQLQHLGKGRPRRVKTRAPTRPMGRAQVLEEDHDISQGVDNFFRPGSSTPTTPLVSPDSENRKGVSEVYSSHCYMFV
ncbi:hypothetical protein Avbf_13040 [Armadillidium vulgare]|nr:hypothetical protein Avbf_13040 [Armadillidium vulgare]